MKRILVTGGAGFLGSHLCDRLLREGHSVICLDNLLTGNRRNIAHMTSSSRFEFIEHDIQLPLKARLDVQEIYNLACPASPVSYQLEPITTLKTNVYGALNTLELAREAGAKILQASTSEVYGDPDVHPQTESYWGNVNPIGIRSCYDEGKRAAETLFFDFSRKFGVPIKVVRIFNTYGPRMDPNDGRVVSNFINQALDGQPITIYGNGKQTRSFCYVDDLIEGFVRMMASQNSFLGPVNLGNPSEFTMLELAEKVIALTGSSSQLSFAPLPADDPRQRQPDITLAQSMLGGWTPRIDLAEGLAKTIRYFEEIRIAS